MINAQTWVCTTFPEVEEPCRFCDKDCKKLLNDVLLLEMPSVASSVLKLLCKAAKVELVEPVPLVPLVPVTALTPEVAVVDDEAVVEPLLEADDEDPLNC
jgi:hypothetical protein